MYTIAERSTLSAYDFWQGQDGWWYASYPLSRFPLLARFMRREMCEHDILARHGYR